MYKVLVGAITPEGEHLLTTYLDKFIPDYQVEPLKSAGIKGKLKNYAPRNDVILIILDDMLWNTCVGVVDDCLARPSVHHYESDEGLKSFLESKFGPIDDVDETGTIPPDMLMGQSAPEDDFIPKSADLSKDSSIGATIPPDSLSGPVIVDDELPTTEESDSVVPTDAPSEVVEKLNTQVRDLQSQLAGKETLIRSLTQQLNDKKSSDADDIAAMIARIRELEGAVAEKDAQLKSSGEDSYVALGKVARAEQVLGEFEDLKQQIKDAVEGRDAVARERDDLSAKVTGLTDEIAGLHKQVESIAILQAEIDAREKRISELEHEVKDKQTLEETLKDTMEENEGVASELAKLRAEIEVLNKQIEDDKARLRELDTVEEQLSERQFEVENLNADIRALNDKLSSQSTDLEQLRADLQRKGSELEEAQRSLEECREDLRQRTTELETCEREKAEALSSASEKSKSTDESIQALERELDEARKTIEGKTAELADVIDKLHNAEAQVEDLTSQLETAGKDFDVKSGEVSDLGDKLAEKAAEIEALTNELADVRRELSERTDERDRLSSQLDDLRQMSSSGMQEVQTQLAAKDEEIQTLRGSLSTREGTISKLTADLAELHTQLADKNQEITETREQLAKVRQELVDAQFAGSEAAISADTQKQALEKVLSEKRSLEDKLVAAEDKRLELETRIKSLEDDLDSERQYRSSLDSANVELTAQNEKYTNTIKRLEESIVRSKADDDMVSRLEKDLLEERRRVARLQSELDVIKRTSDSEFTSDLRLELVRVKKELAELQETTVPASVADVARAELVAARENAAKLELDLVAKDNQINAIQSNVFSQLRNIAIPKGAYAFKFNILAQVSEKLVCVASGSEESTTNVYQVLRSACTANPNRKVIIVDLVTDSSIDKEFGIKKIVSPIDWLKGNKPFREYIANTRYGHVKVLSTALAYINDLFLMTVDWQSRLEELAGFSADVVVLYVGCLNNLVTKVLFDMFSKVMRTYVIVKATPVNLRTTILNLTGFTDLSPTVTVECVNFSDTSSADMYQRLVAKYKAQILRDNEVLQL